MQLVSLFNENWSANRGTFGFMDLLELICFTCDKHLFTLRLSYRRSHEVFLIITEDDAEHYNLQILEANLYVRTMNMAEPVLSALESTLLKIPANYPYQEEFTKNNSCNSWSAQLAKGKFFACVTMRQIIMALNTNNAFLFIFKIWIGTDYLRNGLPIATTPIRTQDHKRIFLNTLSALGFLHCGLGFTLDGY